MDAWSLMDRKVTEYMQSAEGRAYLRDLNVKRDALKAARRIRSGSSAYTLGWTHSGDMKLAGEMPSEMHMWLRTLFPDVHPNERNRMFFRRYRVFSAEGVA